MHQKDNKCGMGHNKEILEKLTKKDLANIEGVKAKFLKTIMGISKYTRSRLHIVQCWALMTPFGMVIPLSQFQSHVTTITHNYSLRGYAF
jgi:hypothetical protein